jgi:uncharacterized protein YlxP (DUF503 family)
VIVGTLEIVLLIRESHSLKARRRVVRSLVDRIRSRFGVAVADVSEEGLWQQAVLGVAAVSNDGRHVDEVLSKVLRFVASEPRAEVIEHRRDIV